MKPYSLGGLVNPLYTLCAGMLGLSIPFVMYRVNFPYASNTAGEEFVGTPSFSVWVSLVAILFSVASMALFPAWGVFVRIFNVVRNEDQRNLHKIIFAIIISSLLFLLVMLAAFYWVSLFSEALKAQSPEMLHHLRSIIGLTERFIIVYSYPSLALLPLLMGILLINFVAEIMYKQIASIVKDEQKIFKFIADYLEYRSLLQTYLTACGIMFSIIPFMASAFFSIYVDLHYLTGEQFPLKNIIMYGLILSVILFVIYVPAYINLANTGKALLNILFPFDSMNNLEITISNRERLDTLLQTNVSVGQSIRTGAVLLGPLMSGLVVLLLGIKL